MQMPVSHVEIDILSDKARDVLFPLFGYLVDQGQITLREGGSVVSKQKGILANWVDSDRLVSVLHDEINRYIISKRDWLALFCAMRDMKMVKDTQRAKWAELMKGLFPYAAKDCTYESIRKGYRKPISEWDELDSLYSLAHTFLQILEKVKNS